MVTVWMLLCGPTHMVQKRVHQIHPLHYSPKACRCFQPIKTISLLSHPKCHEKMDNCMVVTLDLDLCFKKFTDFLLVLNLLCLLSCQNLSEFSGDKYWVRLRMCLANLRPQPRHPSIHSTYPMRYFVRANPPTSTRA